MTVSALAEAASCQDDLPVPVAMRLQQIISETSHITEMCRQVLEPPHHPDAVRLDVLASQALVSVRLVHRAAVHLVAESAVVLGRALALRRMISNVVDNACRAAGPDGTVRVSIRQDPAGAHLEVADSGTGVLHDDHAVRRTRPGLGLRIVDEIMNQHGAWAEVGDSDLGGTALTISFPPVTTTTSTDGSVLGSGSVEGGHRCAS